MAIGRPRAFDIDKTLDLALQVFWRHGYEGASLPSLTKAMGINKPSLYATFGNKEALFRKVLDRYGEVQAAYIREALAAPTARAVVERLLTGAVEVLGNPQNPRGCLAVQGALACGEGADCIRKELAARRRAREVALRQRLQRAKSEGDLATDSDPADLARFVMTVIQGMCVQAAGGTSRKELQRVAQTALRAWPK